MSKRKFVSENSQKPKKRKIDTKYLLLIKSELEQDGQNGDYVSNTISLIEYDKQLIGFLKENAKTKRLTVSRTIRKPRCSYCEEEVLIIDNEDFKFSEHEFDNICRLFPLFGVEFSSGCYELKRGDVYSKKEIWSYLGLDEDSDYKSTKEERESEDFWEDFVKDFF